MNQRSLNFTKKFYLVPLKTALLSLSGIILFCLPAYAQLVSNSNDSGAGSLRNAIASASPGAEIIIDNSLAEVLLESELTIDKSLTIRSNGPNKPRINAQFRSRVFKVTSGSFQISNVEVVNGNTINGGGIHISNASLTVDNCNFENSVASGTQGKGGGIYMDSGSTASISNAVFENNWSNSVGGGICVEAGSGNVLNLQNVQFIDNRAGVAPSGADPGSGGAIFVFGNSTSNISNCRFTLNQAASEGGAIWNSAGTMNITGSTIAQNTIDGQNASRGGAGIYNNSGILNIEKSAITGNSAGTGSDGGGISVGAAGQLNIQSCTIAQNSSSGAGSGLFSASNGISINACTISGNTGAASGVALPAGGQIKNSIVYNNGPGGNNDMSGSVTSLGYNIIGSTMGVGFNNSSGDKLNTNPLITGLGNNGGTTQTFALDAGSPAYNAGDPTDNFTDQIGQSVFGGRRDIGAYESQEVLSSIHGLATADFNVYPNPCADFLKIQGDTEIGKIQVYSMDGRRVISINQDKRELDVSWLEPGMYLITLELDDQLIRSVFVKE